MNRHVLALLTCCGVLSGCSYLPSWAGGGNEEEPKLEGGRVSVAPVVAEIVADPSVASVAVNIPAVNANSDWKQATGNFTAKTGNLALSGDLSHVGSVRVGGGESFAHKLLPRPVVADGRVYAMDAAGAISAHDEGDIEKVLWNSDGVATEDEDDAIGGGLAFDSGVLYAVSGRGIVAAFDAATGVSKWRKVLHAPLRSAPSVGGGKLFVVSLDSQVFALNVVDGETVWTQRGIAEQAGVMNAVSPTVAGDVVIVPYTSGQVYALSVIDGKEAWSEALSAGKNTQASALLSGIGGDPVVDEQVVFSVSTGGMISVQALATGQRSWEKPVGSLNTPWLAGDSLYEVTNTNTLVSFVKYDGRVRWATQLPRFEDPEEKTDPITLKGPVMVDGRLAVVSSDGHLYLVAADSGQLLSTIEIPDGVTAPPVVAGGQLLLMDQDATLYSLR